VPTGERPLRLLLTGLLLLQLAGSFLPAPWLWGINHLAWFPLPLRILVPLLGLIVVWTPLGRRLGHWLTDRAAPLLLDTRRAAYFAVPIWGAVSFWLLRDRTHLLGDGQLLAQLIHQGNAYHGFDLMAYHLHGQLYRLLGLQSEAAAQNLIAVVSVLTGGAWLAAAAWSARSLCDGRAGRILLYGLLVFYAPLQLFMGYVEAYAQLTVALLVFTTALVLHYRGRFALWAVAAAWSIGLFFHLNALLLAPLLVATVIWPSPVAPRSWWRRALAVAWPPALALALVSGLYLLSGYDRAHFAADFGHIGQGAAIFVPLQGPDGLLSWRHWKDVANLVLLLAPLPMVLLVWARWSHCRQTAATPEQTPATTATPARELRELRVLLAGSFWIVLLMSLLHMKLGIVRDWDLFAPHAAVLVVAALLTFGVAPQLRSPSAGAVGRTLTVAAILTVPWFALNASEPRALARIAATAGDLAPFPRGLLHSQLGRYHRERGELPASLRHYREAVRVCPANARFHATYGQLLFNEGDYATAKIAFGRAVAADSSYAYGLKMAVLTDMARQEYRAALPLARRLATLPDEDAEGAAAHGSIAEHLGLYDEAVAAYLRSVRLDSTRVELLARIGGLELSSRHYGRAEFAFSTLLRKRPESVGGRIGLANAIWQDLVERPSRLPAAERRRRLSEIERLLDEALTLGVGDAGDPAQIRAWHAQVVAALNTPIIEEPR